MEAALTHVAAFYFIEFIYLLIASCIFFPRFLFSSNGHVVQKKQIFTNTATDFRSFIYLLFRSFSR